MITRGSVGHKHLTAFTRQLATLIGAGLPLRRSLEILEEQTESTNLKTALEQIVEDIESGSTFSEGLGKHPSVFNKLYVNMVRAGEVSGALEQVLERLAIFAEKRAALRSKIRSAMIYPVIVVLLATVIVAIILIFVVPKFQDIYGGLGGKLPGMTLLLVAASDIIMHRAPLVFGVIAVIIILYWRINKTKMGKTFFDKVKLKLPVFGKLLQKAAIASFSRTFGTLLDTGVPILQSLIIVKDTASNEVVAKAMVDVHASIREGETISEPMRNHAVFPPLVVHMIAVGEETGAIDSMLMKVAEAYEREVEDAVDALTALIEPLLIVFLGIIIGFIVVALYLPIFKIGDVIK